jgi:UPF0716 protein FxsA
MSLKWIIFPILALPVAELVLLLVVTAQIGLLRTFVLQLAISAIGILVLRRAGLARLSRIRAELAAGDPAVRAVGSGQGGAMLAGILLIIPGFITDLLGAALLVPALRRRLAGLARRAFAATGRSRGRDPVIDLAPDEWRDITKPTAKKTRRRTSRR